MKNYLTKKIASFLALTLLLAAGITPGLASAAGASFSLTASKSTVASGASVIIGVYMNGGGSSVNAVQVDLTYPASKLQYVGFSANGSAFEIGAASGGGDGVATIARGSVSTVSGSGLVGTVTFKALVGTGSASIGIAGSSALVSDGNPVPYSSSGVSLNFGAAPPPASSGPAAPVAPVPPKDVTPPIISDVKVKDQTPFSATISWSTNKASDSTVDYGLDANYGLSASASPAVTAHAVTLNSAFLTPETLLHYRVKSTDSSGNVATGNDKAVQLPGVSVTIIVRGADGKPQAGASVTLDGATGTTDSKGIVTLPSSLGNKKITTTFEGVTIQKPITVTKTAQPLPPFQLDLSKKPLNSWMLTSIGLAVVVLTLLGIDAALFGSRMLARVAGIHLIPHGLHRSIGQVAMATTPTTVPIMSPVVTAQPSVSQLLPLKPAAPERTDPPLPEKPVEEVVDEMLAIVEPVPEIATKPELQKPRTALTTPITSIDDILLDQPPQQLLPAVSQKITVIDAHQPLPQPKPQNHKPRARNAKTAPKLPK